MVYSKLTSIEKDVLREIGNIGAGNAATSMSKLINKKVDMQVPSVNIVTYDEMMDLIGGPEELIVALFFQIKGEISGNVYFILSTKEAEELIRKVTNQSNFLLEDLHHNEWALSALQETGNIVTGAYLSALSDFTKLNMQPSIPFLSIDMAGALLTVGLLEISQTSDYAMIIDTTIRSESDSGIQGHFFLLPDPSSLSTIFQGLGIADE
ncbi:chemotaxis protein CheC [Oceanobacillus piezotolerans]|uniref:Chemotaxis protein CheC n=1 Tax=Oceanobacillus piezotolerans TaxID=2448030 RepID=A0A498D951_9BACI|nr:chemotaxis protein CheC [Oceanobacillus piezotolerans]RLL45337.1 chemotaxis protein CheC [Oceanobacillus piezotolerans]